MGCQEGAQSCQRFLEPCQFGTLSVLKSSRKVRQEIACVFDVTLPVFFLEFDLGIFWRPILLGTLIVRSATFVLEAVSENPHSVNVSKAS